MSCAVDDSDLYAFQYGSEACRNDPEIVRAAEDHCWSMQVTEFGGKLRSRCEGKMDFVRMFTPGGTARGSAAGPRMRKRPAASMCF